MGEFHNITQHPCKTQCGWSHPEGKEYNEFYTFRDTCPFLYHTLYPYFLGLLYNADMQNIWVTCPAEKGVDLLVRKETNGDQFYGVNPDWWVIYAEVVEVHGECPHFHHIGQKILFPTCMKQKYICPAGLNNIFPFLNIEPPKCINLKRLHCPDWKEDVFYEIWSE